jgi:DNA-binding transcriptional ArsR family regulator
MRPDDADAVFDALADPTRRSVIRLLSEAGPTTATELAGHLPVSRQAVAKHLATLSDAGLVAGQRSGREVRYELTAAPLAQVMSWMADVGAEWEQRLAALQRHVEARGRAPGA